MQTTREIAERLGVNPQTIRRWSDQYETEMSSESRRADQRMYTEDDLLLLWSVKRWRELGYSLDNITQRIEAGERTTEPPPEEAITSEKHLKPVLVPEAQHATALAEIRQLSAQIQRLQTDRDDAISKLDKERTEWNKERAHVVANYNSQINDLQRQIGRLEGQLGDRRPADYWLRRLAVAVVAAVLLTAALAILLSILVRG